MIAGGECRGEAPEGGRALESAAQPRLKHWQAVTFAGVRGHGWHAPFGASPPLFSAHDLVRKPDTTFRDHALELGRVAARRERSLASSLRGLTRQSMQSAGLLRSAVSLDSLRVSMDHRVEPGGDNGEGTRDELLPRPRSETERGRGSCEAWWRGHAALRPAVRPSPLPPLGCAERSPFPPSRGRMKMRQGGGKMLTWADLAVQSRY